MRKKEEPNYNKVRHNHKLYEYYIGHNDVLIRCDGMSNLVNKLKIKGESRPNLLKRLLKLGRRNVNVKHGEVARYIERHY